MSRRTNKKRLKKINQTQTAGTAAAASTPAQQTEEVQSAAASAPAQQAEPVQTETVPAAAPAAETETAAVQQEAAPVQEETVSAVQETAPSESSAASYDMFLQYQNLEFDITNISARILDKCSAENMDSSDLRIYVKPEDKKAYYVCAGGNSFIDL